MAFDESEIRSLASLARISLGDAEVRASAAQLDRLLDYIARIQAVDVSGAPEHSAGADGMAAPLRPDLERPGLAREVIVASAPSAPLGLFEVPRVIVRTGRGPAGAAEPPADDHDEAIR